MHSHRGVNGVLTQSPLNHAKNNHYDTVFQYLQDHPSIASTLAIAILVFVALTQSGSIPATVARALWDVIVYMTPSRVVAALDKKAKSTPIDESAGPMTFEAKSEAMKRILGLDNSSLSSLFPRAPTLPGFEQYHTRVCFAGVARDLLGTEHRFIRGEGAFSTHQALKGIIERLNSPDSYGQRLWTPADLKSMSSWQQQDAQEYFSKVVDQIDYEIQQATRKQTRNLGLKVASPQENVIGAGSTPGTSADASVGARIAEIRSFGNPLEGLLAQRVGCMQCGWTEGLSLIPFNCLTVPLGAGYEHDVRDCLQDYMDLEPIEGVECAKCTLLHAQKQLQNLLKQLEEDKSLSNTPDSPSVSEALKNSAQERLKAVEEALEEEDFAEKTLSKKCNIPSKNRVSSTKSRQAVIARPPKCLVVHINRSLFDDMTGMLRKNYAALKFPKILDMGEWCLGAAAGQAGQNSETWDMDPRESMLAQADKIADAHGQLYELRAVITHYGRHENGHYICYRKYSSETFPADVPESVIEQDGEKQTTERWFRLSDEDVQMVSESNVMAQGGAFMLFYEAVDSSSLPAETGELDLAEMDNSVSTSSAVTPEDMSSTSTATDDTRTSQVTSVSTPEKAELPVANARPASEVD
ncbi:ubiquitin hydrolase [Aspergillus arachidicola]|uniref:ubiquitinyl hydrolase 1 n=1 Tax=Aspergillus arachidicola TaxID=656916 RepID=A0A2G7GBJ8_9EURO|nr:ubiquitin hydrolase [Aspergillus arachidicola]